MISSTLSLLKTQSGLSLWEEQKPFINWVLLLRESCPLLCLNWKVVLCGHITPSRPSRRWEASCYNFRSLLPLFPKDDGGSFEAQDIQPWNPRVLYVNLVPGLHWTPVPSQNSKSLQPKRWPPLLSVSSPFLQLHPLSHDHTIDWHHPQKVPSLPAPTATWDSATSFNLTCPCSQAPPAGGPLPGPQCKPAPSTALHTFAPRCIPFPPDCLGYPV